MPETIGTDALSKLQQAIGQLHGPLLEKFKGRATYYVALAIKGVIKPYKIKSTPIKWASAKQRRWWFWARRQDGLEDTPYKRGSDPWSQRLQQSWGVTRRPTEATLGNRATYAPYVASDEYQTAQHKATGFTTDKQAADKVIADGTMKRIVDAHVKAIVREAFRGL